jgi:hypothetical protein
MKSLSRRSYNLPLIVLMIVMTFLAWQGSARAGGLRYYQYRGYTTPVQSSIIVGGTTAVASTGHGVFRQRTVQRNRY